MCQNVITKKKDVAAAYYSGNDNLSSNDDFKFDTRTRKRHPKE